MADYAYITYTDEQLAKMRFVEDELTPMLKAATDGYVYTCWYEADGDDELVKVAVKPPAAPVEAFPVNVSCDSLWALAKDVMRAVAERFE